MPPGLEVDARETTTVISDRVLVREGVRIAHAVHLCFGVVHPRGLQQIGMEVRLERAAAVRRIAPKDRRQMETLMAHGLSPDQAVDVIVRGVLR